MMVHDSADVATSTTEPEGAQVTTCALEEEALDSWCGVGLLSLAWACGFSTLTVVIATIALVGEPYAPAPGTQTVPLACVFYSMGLANLLIPFEIRRLGRRGTYLIAAAVGALGCMMVALSVLAESFSMVCLGGSLIGLSAAHAQNYRFAATMLAQSNPPKAIAWVLAGGVLGAVVGPGVLARAKHLLPLPFTGVYVLGIGVQGLAASLIFPIRFPGASRIAAGSAPVDTGATAPRRLVKIFAQPRCWVATYAVSAAYGIMMLSMAPTPLQMSLQFPYDQATLVMMLHMVIMFAPSLATGAFVRRFGPAPVMAVGCASLVLSATALLAGTELPWWYLGLGFLGIGWNLLFVAGTAQLVGTHTPAEGPAVQAANDSLVFLVSGSSSMASAPLVKAIGWDLTQVVVAVASVVTLGVALLPPLFEACAKRGKQPEGADTV